jgi:hypothetical protein
MQFTFSAAFFALVLAVAAVPTKRAACSNGRTAAHASCCVWFDVLDDIQENLYVPLGDVQLSLTPTPTASMAESAVCSSHISEQA